MHAGTFQFSGRGLELVAKIAAEEKHHSPRATILYTLCQYSMYRWGLGQLHSSPMMSEGHSSHLTCSTHTSKHSQGLIHIIKAWVVIDIAQKFRTFTHARSGGEWNWDCINMIVWCTTIATNNYLCCAGTNKILQSSCILGEFHKWLGISKQAIKRVDPEKARRTSLEQGQYSTDNLWQHHRGWHYRAKRWQTGRYLNWTSMGQFPGLLLLCNRVSEWTHGAASGEIFLGHIMHADSPAAHKKPAELNTHIVQKAFHLGLSVVLHAPQPQVVPCCG